MKKKVIKVKNLFIRGYHFLASVRYKILNFNKKKFIQKNNSIIIKNLNYL